MTRLSAGKPVTFNSFTLIPIEETTFYAGAVQKSEFIYASKKPRALVVLYEGATKAYNMKFDEVSVEKLIEETNGLNELINNL